jgi:hypothetical protein
VKDNSIVCHSEPIRLSFANRSQRSEEAHGELREESRHFFALMELSNAGILGSE